MTGQDVTPIVVDLEEISDNIELRKQNLREEVAGEILALLKYSVISTWLAIFLIFFVDVYFIGRGEPADYERLVSHEVLLSVIGATVVQVGAAAFAIVNAQFKDGGDSADK